MTIVEMHELCDLLLDKADSPWFNSIEKDKFLNLAHAEFFESRYRQFEFDERTRKELLPLVKTYTQSNSATIDLSSIPSYVFTLNLIGTFKSKCGTGTTKRPIVPVQLDDEAYNEIDPFTKSDNEFPTYTEENNGTSNLALIKSSSVPLSYVLKYLKSPRFVKNDTANPINNVNSEMPLFTHEEIVNIAVRKMMANTEQQLNYQMQQNEINNEN